MCYVRLDCIKWATFKKMLHAISTMDKYTCILIQKYVNMPPKRSFNGFDNI